MVEYSILKDTQISRKTYIYNVCCFIFTGGPRVWPGGPMGHGQDQGQVGLGQVQQIGAPAVSASTLSVAQGIITG